MEKEKSNAPIPIVNQLQWCSVCRPGKEKSKYAGLAQQNGFGPAFFAEQQIQWCSVCGPGKENWIKKSQNVPV